MITGMKNIVVFVNDLARAKRFYVEQMKLPLGQESMTMMELAPPGGTVLGVALALTDDARTLVGRHTGVTLTVQGIEQFCRDLTAGGVAFAEPLEVSPWGKMAVVKDPDGNQFALVEL
jgi:lactoylglutathione lyase